MVSSDRGGDDNSGDAVKTEHSGDSLCAQRSCYAVCCVRTDAVESPWLVCTEDAQLPPPLRARPPIRGGR